MVRQYSVAKLEASYLAVHSTGDSCSCKGSVTGEVVERRCSRRDFCCAYIVSNANGISWQTLWPLCIPWESHIVMDLL